jgi:hypothetical protein
MGDDDLHQTIAFTIRKIKDGWFVALPDETQVGPYRGGDVALEVAMTHALLARKRGLNARIFVRDEYGGTHACTIIDGMSAKPCRQCEGSWSTSALPAKCLLRAAICGG